MAHFFADPSGIHKDRIVLEGSDVNHMKNVLRLKCGDEVTVSDGAGTTYSCRIAAFSKTEAELDILSSRDKENELKARITLFQGLPKMDRLETIVQKATELGASSIVPVEMKRSVAKWDRSKEEAKLKRLRTIAKSASEQSGRDIIPEVLPAMKTDEAVAYARENCDVILAPYENAEGIENTRKVLKGLAGDSRIGVFIGPEGGFEESEVRLLSDAGAEVLTLGKRILRTETAGPALLAVLMLKLEDGE